MIDWRAAILLGTIAPATAAVAQASSPPEQAAGQALMQCVAHATGQGSITAENHAALSANGLVYSAEPPAFLASTRQTPYGRASYAHALSTEGQVWAVGYDKGTCLVLTLGTSVTPIENRIDAMFAVPNTWKPEAAAPAAPGERKRQFGWAIGKGDKLTALLSLRDLPGEAKGFSMITISKTN